MSERSPVSSDDLHRMHDLLKEILEIQKSTRNPDQGMVRVQEIVQESSKLVENSTCPSDIMVDAKILHVGSNVFNANVLSLSTNLTTFSEETYIQELLHIVDCYKNEGKAAKEGTEWDSLAPYTYHLFRKSEPITFMLGPLTLKPLDSQDCQRLKERKKAERLKKTAQVEKKVLECVTENEETEEEGSDIYQHILKCLVRQYKKNNRTPINYLEFVLNPEDYWKTVENIFHFSFLVRDGSVKMSMQNGLPIVEPVFRKTEDEASSKSKYSQFCFSLSVSDWKECIKKFKIGTPSIPPIKKGGTH